MQRRPRVVLEPMGKAWVWMVLVHGLIATAIWYGLIHLPLAVGANAGPQSGSPEVQEKFRWVSPSDFQKEYEAPRVVEADATAAEKVEQVEEEALPKMDMVPTVAEAAALSTAVPEATESAPKRDDGRAGNRFITLSRLTSDLAEPPSASKSARLSGPVPTLLDVARSIESPPVAQDLGVGGSAVRSGLDQVDAAIQEAFMENWVAPPISKVDVSRRTARLEVSVGRDGTVVGTLLFQPSGAASLDLSILEAAKKVKKIPVSLPAGFANSFYQLQVNFQID